MKAEHAKKLAEEAKKQFSERIEIAKADRHQGDVDSLLEHFKTKIEDAALAGKRNIVPVEFQQDRYSPDVLREVVQSLRDDDFNVNQTFHNAFGKTKFEVSW